MFQRLSLLFSSATAPKMSPQLTLTEQLTIDPSVKDKLGVSSVAVVEDAALPLSVPWKISRRAALDSSPGRDSGEKEMTAEIRLSPALANQTMHQGSLSHTYLKQMLSVFPYVVYETRSASTEVSVDTSLPYSKPYRVFNRLDFNGGEAHQLVTHVSITPYFADQAQRPEYTKFFNGFATDLRIMSGRGFLVSPASTEGMLEVSSAFNEFAPYLVADSVKRIIDVCTSALDRSSAHARRYDPGAKRPLEALLDNAIELHRLHNALNEDSRNLFVAGRYERTVKLLAQVQHHEEALADAREKASHFFGEETLDSLLFAIEYHRGDIGDMHQYLRDMGKIHGYRFWQYQERLEYFFAMHPLSRLISDHNEACQERRAQQYRSSESMVEPETILFLEFRLSSTDINCSPQVSVTASSPYEKVWDYNHNERLVCVNLTPTALKLLLNARSLEDESVRPLTDEIDRATANLFRRR